MRPQTPGVAAFMGPEYDAAAAALGRALVADGATAQWLSDRLRDGCPVGPAPTLIDLVSRRPQCGYNTLALVQLSGLQSQAANKAVESYRRSVNADASDDLRGVIDALEGDPRHIEDLRYNLSQAQRAQTADSEKGIEGAAATFAYEHIPTPDIDVVRAAMEGFGRSAPMDIVRTGMCIGARDRLNDTCIIADKQDSPLLRSVRTSVAMHEVLRLLFGERADACIMGVDNLLVRVRNSQMVHAEVGKRMAFRPSSLSPLRVVFGDLLSGWRAIIVMATAKADAALIDRIRWPRPQAAALSFVGAALASPGVTVQHVRQAVFRDRSMTRSEFPTKRGLQVLGRALAKDGVTQEQLVENLRKWQRSGEADINLLDLLADIGPRLSATVARVRQAAIDSGVANRMALDYRYRVEGSEGDRVLALARALHPEPMSLEDIRRASEAAQAEGSPDAGWREVLKEAGGYAFGDLLKDSPEAFAAAVTQFEQAAPLAPVGAVRDAMRVGSRDRLLFWLAFPYRLRRADARDVDRLPHGFASLRVMFGARYDTFSARYNFERNRVETAYDIGFDADPLHTLKAARSWRRPARNDEVAEVIMRLAISPISEALIADIPIAMPKRR